MYYNPHRAMVYMIVMEINWDVVVSSNEFALSILQNLIILCPCKPNLERKVLFPCTNNFLFGRSRQVIRIRHLVLLMQIMQKVFVDKFLEGKPRTRI